jgi:hypothetical protein
MGTRSEKRQADAFPNKIDVAARIPQTDTVPPESAGVETMRSLFFGSGSVCRSRFPPAFGISAISDRGYSGRVEVGGDDADQLRHHTFF